MGSSIKDKHGSTLIQGYSSLPEVVDTRSLREIGGKEAVPREVEGPQVWKKGPRISGLEVAGGEEKEAVHVAAHYGSEARYWPGDGEELVNPSAKRRRKRTLVWITGGLVLLLILGIALDVGLGFGLQSTARAQHAHEDGSASDEKGNSSASTSVPSTLSTKGAFNGSSFSMRRQHELLNVTSGVLGTQQSDPRNLLLVYQHYMGELRWMQRLWPDTWLGGSTSESITTWAKNGTPLSIMASSSSLEGLAEWHVFYVGKNNRLRQQTINNVTRTWQPGLLDDSHVVALDADKVGLSVCYYTGPIDDPSYNASSGDSGIRLFIATSDTTFAQLSWQPGMPAWAFEQQWTGLNGNAQPACNGWSAGSTTYAMFVDQDDQVAFYWNDHGDDEPTPEHPTHEWVKASLNIPAVDPVAGLSYGYGGNLFARTSDNGPVLGWNITFDAEATAISGSSLSQVSGQEAIEESSLASWSIDPKASADGQYEVLVFYQTEGDDITMFSGDVLSGEWTETKVPVPDA